jgi:hypothetical protein
MARYKQLLYFATKLEPLPEADHVPANKVEGCVSQVCPHCATFNCNIEHRGGGLRVAGLPPLRTLNKTIVVHIAVLRATNHRCRCLCPLPSIDGSVSSMTSSVPAVCVSGVGEAGAAHGWLHLLARRLRLAAYQGELQLCICLW